MTSLLWQKTSFFDPHMIPGGKMKIPKPYCTSAWYPKSYPRVSIVYSWKCWWSSSDNHYRKNETSFFNPHLTPRDKMKIPKPFCTSTRHFQSYPRVSFVYSIKCIDRVPVTTTSPKRHFLALMVIDPWGKIENSKPLLGICKIFPIRS